MAKFKIYSPAGTEIYEGTPSFTGQYMAPGLLEFREIASPVPLDLVAGCYVDYTRTGFRYRIYGVPQVKKQARRRSYGGAFIYQNVQLYDASKMLEFCPFRDLVKGDNRIHFSTQPSISTFEGVDGLARRFEACLQDQYGANSWRVRVATVEDDGISQDLADLMADAREFTVSGVNILECLNKVYEIWPEVGWVYTVESGIDTIIIGGAGLNANQGTYAYGKGKGLTSLTRTVANADEMANRIYAYGSSRNMLPRWYNNQTIKDAESVDIQNLMIPISEWVLTDVDGGLLPDASKAYVEDDASITKIGLRPATVYFDGSGEYPEIYPTLRGMTIGEVRTAIQRYASSPKWLPSTSVYTDASARVDVLKSAQAAFDSGLAGDNGKNTIFTEYQSVAASGSETVEAGTKRYTQTIITQSVEFSASEAGTRNVSIMLSMPGSMSLTGATSAVVRASLHKDHPANASTVMSQVELTPGATAGTFNFSTIVLSGMKKEIAAGTYYLVVDLDVALEESETDLTLTYDASGDLSVSLSQYRSKTFTVTLKQIGFDISEQAALGDGKTISMRSGSCVGRSFTINTVQYDSAGDAWVLECFRSEDESLSQWFPNTDYPVRAGDEFVLLDIAMPEIYIGIAEGRLLQAAQDLLSDTATERWQYVPEIDAKYMVENNRVIRAGEYMTLLDPEIIEEGTDGYVYFKTSNDEYLLTSNGEKIIVGGGMVTAILVDTIVINEGEASIPTYKVTLRDRKRKTWTESESAPTSTSKSVGTVNEVAETSSSGSGDSFWTLDDNGNVTLKSQYENAWVPGWLAAGGIGTESSGGVSFLKELTDIYHNENGILRSDGTAVQNGDVLVYDSTNARWSAAAQSGGGGSSVSWGAESGYTASLTVDGVSKTVLLNGALSGYATTSQLSGYLPLTGGTLTGDLRLKNTGNYGLAINFGDGNYVYLKEATDDVLSIYAKNGISLSASETSSKFEWDSDNNAWHFHGNVYADGWMAAGGIGSGSSGGSNVSISNLLSSGTRVATITIDGTGYDILAPSGGSGGGGTVTSITLTSGTGITVSNSGTAITTTGSRTISISSTYRNYINHGETAYGWGDHAEAGYVTLSTTQEITGAKTFSTNPVTIASDSGISVNAASYIDIGDARLIYDSGANALHVTRRTGGTSNVVGLFADGFVAAGGVAGQSTVSYVTLDTAQTISGDKTFTGTTVLGQTRIGNIEILGSGTTPYINNTLDRIYIQRGGQTGVSMCATAGQVVIGALNTTNTSKLFVNGNAAFTYATGNTISISEIVSRIEALENA